MLLEKIQKTLMEKYKVKWKEHNVNSPIVINMKSKNHDDIRENIDKWSNVLKQWRVGEINRIDKEKCDRMLLETRHGNITVSLYDTGTIMLQSKTALVDFMNTNLDHISKYIMANAAHPGKNQRKTKQKPEKAHKASADQAAPKAEAAIKNITTTSMMNDDIINWRAALLFRLRAFQIYFPPFFLSFIPSSNRQFSARWSLRPSARCPARSDVGTKEGKRDGKRRRDTSDK